MAKVQVSISNSTHQLLQEAGMFCLLRGGVNAGDRWALKIDRDAARRLDQLSLDPDTAMRMLVTSASESTAVHP